MLAGCGHGCERSAARSGTFNRAIELMPFVFRDRALQRRHVLARIFNSEITQLERVIPALKKTDEPTQDATDGNERLG